ncbi:MULTISPECIES: acyl-CoA dehydrogenase family protein [unclassified Rhodococcus (in: high G+C Gram-positive bacteria)]|uniref:acyl-CoA dehydrogenase family protein n=1 Tax=unclassified Rhodococcus (in: high G+C Gram-positive bacteria) TaxID=192944 RepID=UPI0016395896|nr:MULTISPECIES: acyl-CoA dehydrogenase family protein [unclassified Rhodococcus (in: high G+C Gram-positive bacteria)]MBC2638001.1 acyl-CoA dehydrogenase [Rhodococcus sp. 3A]MBC2897252.1 acyl-CoA dehydrogenase [Rhodococcus sp. 4CII]
MSAGVSSGPTAATVAAIIRAGDAELPLPGGGATADRWAHLTRWSSRDLAVGRLLEAHADADAILAELDGTRAGRDEVWGVWASEPPHPVLDASESSSGWRLRGTKAWCSGASMCTHALVTARVAGQPRLFAVDLREPRVAAGTGGWRNPGMAATDTESVTFDDVPARPIGAATAYLERPGFWHGGIGVAACWFGGALAVAEPLRARAGSGRADSHQLAHLGAVDVAVSAARWSLASAAGEVDASPFDHRSARVRAFRVRGLIERTASEVIDRVGRALGAAPLATNAEHARNVADLLVYIRQSHAEHDLATLGELVAGED